MKVDIERAAAQGTAGSAETPPPQAVEAPVTVQALTPVQTTIATRMTDSKATVPDFTVTTDVEMDAALELRSRWLSSNSSRSRRSTTSCSAPVRSRCARTRASTPATPTTGSRSTGGSTSRSRCAAPGVLLVPVVSDADTKTLAQLAAETRALAERARSGALTPSEVADATFTISNLGMYGITQFTAILNPPQAAILAVGSIREHAVVRDGDLVPRRRMTLTLTCDHRILYGADAALFLQSIRTTLEHPLKLLV